ncbi:MAG: LysR family transcriptional regulator [Hydrogenophilales bacterium 16-64-46]|nr:MAG: LysR family transcriptional regulator [Hydrogenophilales bacterium 12-64-13]OYZ07170.1 MAG: LysR family transcriptional regulator [Hydrogenophilales bacterium 16-64-46]OZA37361.1 MAG: LysR family transcriptional regulator [Hydrogenophilales bacterium 17-64-34]HQT00621.1 winged helix-turn-helix domain-containing protein [Thiobacillus sp.]
MMPRLAFRVLLGDDIALGPGKVRLLEAIIETGSIAAAGRSMAMSYKRAWHLVDTMNRCFNTPLVESTKGGAHGGGATVTPLGHEVIARYRALEHHARAAAAQDFAALAKHLADHNIHGNESSDKK